MTSKVGQYLLFETIGTGAFGRVKVGVHEESGAQVAIKILEKSAIQENSLTLQVRREVAIMKALRHPNIVNLHQVLTSATKIYMVMDLVNGEELFGKIAKRGEGGLPEHQARDYFRQLVDGVHYCHKRGVYHRDLKPENILVSEEGEVKVTDFGLSTIRGEDENGDTLQTQCGTPSYVAPEIIGKGAKGYSGQKVDTWACGIILFALLAGYLPFDGEDITELFGNIQRSEVVYPSWISPEAKDLIRRMLFKNADKRLNLKDVKEHPWFTQGAIDRTTSSSSSDTVSVRQDSSGTPAVDMGVPKLHGFELPTSNVPVGPNEDRGSSSSQSSIQSETQQVGQQRKKSAIFSPLAQGLTQLKDSSGDSIGLPPASARNGASPDNLPRVSSRSGRSDKSNSMQEEDESEDEDDEDETNLPDEDMKVVKSIRRVQTLVVMSGRNVEKSTTKSKRPAPRAESKHFNELKEMLQPHRDADDPGSELELKAERDNTVVALRTIESRLNGVQPTSIGVSPSEVDVVKRIVGLWLSSLLEADSSGEGDIGERDMSVFRRVLAKLDSTIMGSNAAEDLKASEDEAESKQPRTKPTISEDDMHRAYAEITRAHGVGNSILGSPLYMNTQNGTASTNGKPHEKHEKVAAGMGGLKNAVNGFSPAQTVIGTQFESGYRVDHCLIELGKVMLKLGYQVVRKRGETKFKCFVTKKKLPVSVELHATDRNTSLVIFRKGRAERGKPRIDTNGLYQIYNVVIMEFGALGPGAVM